MDVTAHPSHSENVGAASEAFILGRPVVATNVGGFPDVVIDGVTGWLVPPRAPSALADALVDALANPARTAALTAAGTARTRALLDVEKSTAIIRAVYRELVMNVRAR
jgi:glycosyltransferase involved in cell wall biosynthesis